eukprot:5762960-Prymnesium_polylepis.2
MRAASSCLLIRQPEATKSLPPMASHIRVYGSTERSDGDCCDGAHGTCVLLWKTGPKGSTSPSRWSRCRRVRRACSGRRGCRVGTPAGRRRSPCRCTTNAPPSPSLCHGLPPAARGKKSRASGPRTG